VNEEFLNLEQQSMARPEGPASLSGFSCLVSGVLDSFAFFFFCLSFSGLTHLLGSWWNRFLAEE